MTPATRISAIEDATVSYEAWLEAQTPVVPGDLEVKHRRMSKDPFTFLRGTFYRWAQVWPVECRDDMDAPRIPAMGASGINESPAPRSLTRTALSF